MITVYSQANCPGCTALKMMLQSKGIEFEEKRIDLDTEAKAFVLGAGHKSVPIVYQDGSHIVDPLTWFRREQ